MNEKSITNYSYSMSDKAVLRTLGTNLKRMRLNRNITQEEMSKKAGVSRSTISLIEKAGNGSLASFVRILRALEKLEMLNLFSTEMMVSPIQIAKLYGKERKRASSVN